MEDSTKTETSLSNNTAASSSTENEENLSNNCSSLSPSPSPSLIEITTEDIISFISLNIKNKIIENKKKYNGLPINKNDLLYSNKIPLISIKNYFIRIMKYSKIRGCTLIATLIYIKRFIIKQKFIISLNNIYKLIIGCVVLAIKYNESSNYKNKFYAEIGGLDLKEFNLIEMDIFQRLDFDLYIFDCEYNNVIQKIINEKSFGLL